MVRRLAARYPDIDFIDVVNEPLHDPPDGPGRRQLHRRARRRRRRPAGSGCSESFRLARQYFPNAQLGINEFSVTNNTTDMQRYIGIIAAAAGRRR